MVDHRVAVTLGEDIANVRVDYYHEARQLAVYLAWCCRGRIQTSTSADGGQDHVHSRHVHLSPHTAHGTQISSIQRVQPITGLTGNDAARSTVAI